MRLLIYTHEFPPFLGGLATTSYKLAKGLSESGLKLCVLAPGYSRKDKDIDKTLKNCKVTRIPFLGKKWVRKIPFLQYLIGFLFLSKTILRYRPETVLFITEEAEVVGGLFPFFNFKPIVRVAGSGITTCFLDNKINKMLLRFPIRRLYRKAHRIVAVSNYTKELLRSINIPEEKITVIYNGVENQMLYKEPDPKNIESIKRELGIKESEKILLTVARVLPRKGQDMVIKALPKVVKRFPDLKYVIAGEGRYIKKFKKLAEENGVGEHVVFTGGIPHERTIDFYDMCDVFIMPNRFWNNKVEGLPNAILEGSARGKPIIAGAHGGSKEAVKHGITGYLVNPENTDEIANTIVELLGDEKKAKQMGQNGRLMVKSMFAEECMIKNFIRLLKEDQNP